MSHCLCKVVWLSLLTTDQYWKIQHPRFLDTGVEDLFFNSWWNGAVDTFAVMSKEGVKRENVDGREGKKKNKKKKTIQR